MTDVGFIGLGTMGGPMALNVLKKGHRLTVFDISDKAVAALTAAGAKAAPSPKAVAAAKKASSGIATACFPTSRTLSMTSLPPPNGLSNAAGPHRRSSPSPAVAMVVCSWEP